MALAALVSTRPGVADPGDIFSLAAPTLGAESPKAIPIPDGDSSVSTQTGALNYSYPVQVPPGRQGAQPSLALVYSSQAPIYGGLAAGWSLSGMPMISLDTSRGRLEGVRRFSSSMSGGRHLISVDEPSARDTSPFRAQGDGTFVRYQKMAPRGDFPWMAMSPDGMTYIFGDASHVGDCTIVSDEYAPLTSTLDSFGNMVEYFWEKGVEGECRIHGIAWGRNDGAEVGHFASVLFQYAASPPTCAGIPVGSQTSYRSGTKIVMGASRLDAIVARAFTPQADVSALFDPGSTAQHERTIRLGYDPILSGCGFETSYRGLTSIEESASGVDSPLVTLPAITFKYGASSLLYQAQPATPFVPWASSAGSGPLHNLGWGYRPRGSNAWPTVEAMMVDIDGDGLIDRLLNEPGIENGRTFCGARWYRNLGPSHAGSGQFQPAGYIEIPTLKWATEDSVFSTTPWIGGAGPGVSQSRGALERCALNYQRTAYINSNSGGIAGTCSSQAACSLSADGSTGVCSDGSDCWPLKTNNAENTLWSWRWFDIDGDGKTDLIGSPARGGLNSYNVRWAPLSNVPNSDWPRFEPPIFGVSTRERGEPDDGRGFPSCPTTPTTAYPADAHQPYTMCRGMFPWFVYKNHGGAVFGRGRAKGGSTNPNATWGHEPDEIIYQPIPLESSTGDSSITANPVGVTQGTIDIDGDGYADAVRQLGSTWSVYRNDGTGRLVGNNGPSPFTFSTGPNFTLFSTALSLFTAPQSVSGLVDVNGDGLTDHWDAAVNSSSANIHLNDGVSFRLDDNLVTAKPGADGVTEVAADEHQGDFICRGTRTDTRRLLDANSDGRADIVTKGSLFPEIWFNAGGAYATPFGGTTGTPEAALLRRTIVRTDVDENVCEEQLASWEIRSDMIDLDGDGIPEAVDFGPANANPLVMNLSRVNALALQPRLLVEIDNHRGAKTTVSYGSMSSAAVQQDSSSGRTHPHTQWVVQSTATTDSLSGTTATTSYLYRFPRFHPDDLGKYGFRGFELVDTTMPSGAHSIKRYGYAPDWSGRLEMTMLVAASTDGTGARTIDETTWERRALFDDSVESFHATASEHWACKNGQDEIACRTDTSGYRRSVTTISALASTTTSDSTPLLWYPTSTRLQAGAVAAPGDRSTTMTYALASSGTNYRLRDLETIAVEHGATTATTFDRTRKTWDSSFRVQLTSETWFDTVDANRAIERWVYDMTTGNVIQHFKPVQNAANAGSTSMQYDARKLFVERSSNELGHQTSSTYEYGTGSTLVTRGPNVPTCAAASTCPAGTSLTEEHRTRVDGLGRPIERFETFSDDGQVYTSRKVAIIDYVDVQPNGTGATSVTTRGALDVDASNTITYGQVKTEFDGLGRPITERVSVFGSAPADQITTYRYRNDGTLREVSVPDPSLNDATTVSYLYNFDSIGRPTELIRPDATAEGDRSRVRFSYDGLTKTRTEIVGRAGGQPARTTTIADRFGRLIRVDEEAVPLSFASTRYDYGADDLVAAITDPDGVRTTLVHDFGGRRTRIERAGRVWRYGYDKNSNMISQTVPGSTGTLTDAAFTTTTAYDALDRVSSRSVGQRSLSAEDQATFASATELFTWDVGPNHIGRLRFWKTFAPGATTPAVAIDLANNLQGQRTGTSQTLMNADYPSLTRQVSRDYYINGAPRRTQYQDQVGSSASTSSLVTQDRRGLPSSMVLSMTGLPDQTIAVQTRNVAGVVTKRRSNVTSPMGYIESNWTYDRLGRITDQVVQKGPGTTQVARQKLEYFGNDDPAALDHWIGSTNRKRFEYRYDLRHQLVGVTETAAGGAFSATYQYGSAGRFQRATEAARSLPGSDVKPRDVSYQYASTDPEQLTKLLKPDGTQFASYEYDAAGNQTYRCEGVIRPLPGGNAGSQKNAICVGESLYMIYDGDDRLRRVTKYMGNARGGDEEYTYDNAGMRVATIKHDGSPKKTELVWWLGDTEAHYDAAGAISFVYSHATIGTVAARVRRSSTGASMEFQFHGLGKNTLAAVDRDTGNVNTAFVYAPFGEIVEASDSSSGVAAHRRRMNDKFVDEISDLAYYGLRYYDKHSMTWVQTDPRYRFAPDTTWSQPRRALLYVAHLQNPLRYLDPDGRDVVLVGSAQPTDTMNLSFAQIRAAAGRAGSFTTMSTEQKATKVINNAASATKALAGRSDTKVAYFGHGFIGPRALNPGGGMDEGKGISPTQLAAAVAGMKQQPTDIYLYGCDTDDSGFAQELADLLPGVTVHAYAGDFDVDASGPTDKKGDVKKDEVTLNPRNPGEEKAHTDSSSQKKAAPADANEDGRTTNEEESAWSARQQ